jgi:PAS domain-containing protein
MSAHPKLVTYGEEPLPFGRLLSNSSTTLVNCEVNQARGVFEKIPKTIGEIFGVNPGELARWSDSAALSSFLGHDHSDAALRRKLEQERLESDERFRLTIECLPTAVIVANREGNMFLLNSRTTEMFDYQREEMLGQRIEMLLPHILRKCRDEKDTEVLVHPGYKL